MTKTFCAMYHLPEIYKTAAILALSGETRVLSVPSHFSLNVQSTPPVSGALGVIGLVAGPVKIKGCDSFRRGVHHKKRLPDICFIMHYVKGVFLSVYRRLNRTHSAGNVPVSVS